MERIEGVAIVTGASRGIGRGVAEELARKRAHVFLAARSASELEEVRQGITAEGGTATALVCDVRSESEVQALFDAASKFGPLRSLVCCAGILHKTHVTDLALEDWQEVIATNLTGTFLCTRAALRSMSPGATIITMSSLSGVYATEKFPGLAAYNASKNGVVGLTEALAVEGRDLGIAAICVSPGAVDTEMLRAANPDLKAGLDPQDMGRLIVALLDPAMAAASGSNILLFSNR